MSVSNKNSNRWIAMRAGIPAIVSVILLIGAGAANATENGNTEYPLGVDTFGNALMPPPNSAVLLSYNEYFDGSIYSGTKSLDESHVGVFASVYRGIYTWPVAYDDGKISMSSQLILGGGNVSLKVPTPGGPLSNGSTGLVDPALWPVSLNYHSGPVFISLSTVIWVPLGTYNKNAVPAKGLGENHYTIAPTLYYTYITPKFQVDLGSVTEFSTINPNTRYTSGADETVSGGFVYNLTQKISLGPAAYLYEQFTNDTQTGVIIPKGNRGQTLGIGVQAAYSIGHGGILLKYLHDTLVQNKAGGDQFWLEWACPL